MWHHLGSRELRLRHYGLFLGPAPLVDAAFLDRHHPTSLASPTSQRLHYNLGLAFTFHAYLVWKVPAGKLTLLPATWPEGLSLEYWYKPPWSNNFGIYEPEKLAPWSMPSSASSLSIQSSMYHMSYEAETGKIFPSVTLDPFVCSLSLEMNVFLMRLEG